MKVLIILLSLLAPHCYALLVQFIYEFFLFKGILNVLPIKDLKIGQLGVVLKLC